MLDVSKIRVNLRRRIVYHNKKYGTDLSVENFDKLNRRDLLRAEKRLKRAQQQVKFERKKAALLERAKEAGATINPANIRGNKTLERALTAVKKAERERITKSELDSFMNRLQHYNTIKRFKREGDDRLYFVPKTRRELNKFSRILSHAERGEMKKVAGLLKSGNKNFREFTRFNNNGQEDFKSYVYKANYLNSLRENGWSELADIIEKYGIPLIRELTDIGFHIDFFGYLDEHGEEADLEDYVLSGLEYAIDSLSPQYRAELTRYVKKHKN